MISSRGARVTVGAGVTSALLTGLSADPHTFTVDAINATGAGPASDPSNQVLPQPGGTFHR